MGSAEMDSVSPVHFSQGDAICEFSLPGLGFQAAWEGLSTDGLQREGSEPEGVVVAQGRVYIAWASTGWITSHKRAAGGWSDPERLALGARLVPWGMRLGPDGALYVAVNPSYFQEGSYGDEPRARGVGTVMRVPLTETGLFASRARTFVNPGHLSRPSGLCFDSQGDLLVTHMGAQVLKFAGPLSKRPGSYLGVLIDTRLPQHGLGPALATCSMPPKPFDICWCGGMLFMTTHTCSVEGEAEHGKLSVWDESGVLLKIGGPQRRPSLVTTKRPELAAEIRRACAPAFNPDNLRKTFPVIRQCVSSVSDALAERARHQQQRQEERLPVEAGEDMCDAALRVALDAIGIALFARDFKASSYGDSPVLETLPQVLEEISLRALNPLRAVRHTLLPWTREAQEFECGLRYIHHLWAELARETRAIDLAEAEARGDTSLRVCLAKMRDPATGQLLSEDELAPNIATFLVAGFESTAHSVAWALYDLARHPEAQAKLAAELGAGGLLWNQGQPGRELQFGDLSTLPYLEQVWKESLRLHPAGSVVPIRQSDREVTLRNGVRCPPGTFFWLSIIALHLSPFNYTEPHRFWPERWQQQPPQPAQQGSSANGKHFANGAFLRASPTAAAFGAREQPVAGNGGVCPFGSSSSGHPTPAGNSAAPGRSFMPYAIGSNDCIGQGLANVVGKAMLAMLCSRFAFTIAPRMGSPEDVRAAEVIRLTLQPGDGVWLLLTPRDGAVGHGERPLASRACGAPAAAAAGGVV
ncbi:hypothetical protein N2152v2_004749 [Parachlorella kessleri]